MSRRILAAALCAVCLAVPAIGQEGVASFYGPGFHGRLTASGETFNQNADTCAHRSLSFGVKVRVLNLRTGKSAVCRINDRGPYSGGRLIDVSKAIAAQLGMIRAGIAKVKITIIK
jgi:rare lipoprotein A